MMGASDLILSQLVDVGTPSCKQFLYILYAILCNFTCVFMQFGIWKLSMMAKPKI